jgi:Family of unknown function (DUF6502)
MTRRRRSGLAAISDALFLDAARLERVGALKPARARVKHRNKAGAPGLSALTTDVLLDAAIGYLIQSGCDRKELAAKLRESVQRVEEGAPFISAAGLPDFECLHRLSGALHDWFRDPLYAGKDGKPKCVRWAGPAPSIEHLIRRRFARAHVRSVLRWIKAMGLLKKHSSRLIAPPGIRSLIIGGEGPLTNARVATLVRHFLATALHNVRAIAPSKISFDRTAHVRHLAVKHVPEFRAYLKEHGQVFLELIDHWLENRAPKRGEESIGAGVHLYQYLQPMDEGGQAPKSANRRAGKRIA